MELSDTRLSIVDGIEVPVPKIFSAKRFSSCGILVEGTAWAGTVVLLREASVVSGADMSPEIFGGAECPAARLEGAFVSVVIR